MFYRGVKLQRYLCILQNQLLYEKSGTYRKIKTKGKLRTCAQLIFLSCCSLLRSSYWLKKCVYTAPSVRYCMFIRFLPDCFGLDEEGFYGLLS